MSIFSYRNIATPAFFWFPLAWNIFFHPLTFSLYVSLDLKWVSCRQDIYGSCFCIHSASLCLLVGALKPFTCKMIIMYVLIGFCYLFWIYFCRSFFFPSSFVLFSCDLMTNFSFVFAFLCVCVCVSIVDFQFVVTMRF